MKDGLCLHNSVVKDVYQQRLTAEANQPSLAPLGVTNADI